MSELTHAEHVTMQVIPTYDVAADLFARGETLAGNPTDYAAAATLARADQINVSRPQAVVVRAPYERPDSEPQYHTDIDPEATVVHITPEALTTDGINRALWQQLQTTHNSDYPHVRRRVKPTALAAAGLLAVGCIGRAIGMADIDADAAEWARMIGNGALGTGAWFGVYAGVDYGRAKILQRMHPHIFVPDTRLQPMSIIPRTEAMQR